MNVEEELVSVIVPAFNAEATIDETLRSVRFQTHRQLEIVVVDDGSTDGTRAVVDRHVADDARVRVIEQANRGPSSARNHGIEVTGGAFIAPVDADDLWAPDKIARQLRAAVADKDIGLVYTWFAVIDERSCIRFLDSRSEAEGHVVEALCGRNIVANGSSPLMTRQAVETAGGYDEGLLGCEDYKLYFKIAEKFRFALIRDFLTGYRDLAESQSSNFELMLEAHAKCEVEFGTAYPQWTSKLRRNRTRLLRFMAARSHRAGNDLQAARLLWRMMKEDPLGALPTLAELGLNRSRRRSKKPGSGNDPLGTRFPIGNSLAADAGH
jgi:glycosyltransferase involved in cell wall biosynthesis